MTIKFSALLPVYLGDDPDLFEKSYRSVSEDQVLKANEIVVVCDGPVSQQVSDFLDSRPAAEHLQVVQLPQNVGVASAVNAGLRVAKFDFVARQDADDVSDPRRFELQIAKAEEGFDIVGSLLTEQHSQLVRQIPDSDLLSYTKRRTPFFQPTVVFNRQLALSVGGHPEHLKLGEDQVLWAKMLKAGARGTNLQQSLVTYNETGSFERRSGLLGEIRFLRELRKTGVFSPIAAIGRLGWRLIPAAVRRRLYHFFR